VASIPAVKVLVERNAGRGLRLIGVTRDGADAAERANVEKVAREHGMTAPSYLDVGGGWSKQADVGLAPAFLLVDRDGRLAYRYVGMLSEDSDAFRAMTAALEKM